MGLKRQELDAAMGGLLDAHTSYLNADHHARTPDADGARALDTYLTAERNRGVALRDALVAWSAFVEEERAELAERRAFMVDR